MLSQPEKSLRFKVWATIFVTLIIISTAVIWSYQSFHELTGSIDKLSQPSHKLTLINNILRDFISAENNVQSYIITGSVKSARTYEKQVDETRLKIKKLKELVEEDSSQLSRVDSLEVIFQKKLDYLNRFLILKKQRQAITFTKMALDQIEASTKDTLATRNQLNVLNNKPEQKDVHGAESQLEGLWNSIRELYDRQGIPYDTSNWSGNGYLAYSADASELIGKAQFHPDSLLSRVKAILSETGDIELQMQQNLTQREFALLNQGRVFMDEIQSIIQELEANERLITAARKNEASAIATNSTQTIGLIGLGGLSIAVLLLLLISRDIARASYFRRKLEKAKQKAEQFGKMKESFLANMSHEIRTPLNSILGFTHLMKHTKLSADQQSYVGAVNGSSNYLMELVNDILDHSKIESGKLELVNKPFMTDMLAAEARSMFLLMAENKQLEFEVTVGANVACSLRGDAFRLKQIINNLLSNALKFTHSGRVALKIDGSWFKEVFYLEVAVADTGIGIEEDKLEMIFESFKQEEAAMSDHFGGTGLGLSICRQLAEAMGGSISAVSAKGTGTTFTLKVPLEKVEDQLIEGKKIDDLSEQFYEANVVLVEDDHWNALLLETLLRKKVRNVKVFLNPEEAVHYVGSHQNEIDLLFTDMKMPEMTGEELAKRCRMAGYEQPIIVVSAYLPKHKEVRLERLGVQAVMNKPYQEGQVDEFLKQFLDQPGIDSKVGEMGFTANGPEQGIDLTDLNLFAGNDPQVLEELLRELVGNNERQVIAFEALIMKNDWTGLADLAHKMLPTYDHTRMHHISELLQSIVLYSELGNYQRIEALSHETYSELQDCLKAFEKLKSQFHIA